MRRKGLCRRFDDAIRSAKNGLGGLGGFKRGLHSMIKAVVKHQVVASSSGMGSQHHDHSSGVHVLISDEDTVPTECTPGMCDVTGNESHFIVSSFFNSYSKVSFLGEGSNAALSMMGWKLSPIMG